jgi:hypothetical protein
MEGGEAVCGAGWMERSTLRQRAIRELRELWKLELSSDDWNPEGVRELASRVVERKVELHGKFEVVLDMVLVDELDALRKCTRARCEAEGWNVPGLVAEEAEPDLQYLRFFCEFGCSLGEEEARAMVAGRVACGLWSQGCAEVRCDIVAGGLCCEYSECCSAAYGRGAEGSIAEVNFFAEHDEQEDCSGCCTGGCEGLVQWRHNPWRKEEDMGWMEVVDVTE